MLLLKITGSIIIVISTSIIGYQYGNRFNKRVNNLNYIQSSLQLLQTEIIYSLTPLPTALENVYLKGNKKVSFIFKDIKDNLISNKGSSIIDSFRYISQDLKEKLYLNDEDIEVILSLGSILGSSNREDQEKHFKLVKTQLEDRIKDAESSRIKNEKLYKNLGVLSGMLIVITLL